MPWSGAEDANGFLFCAAPTLGLSGCSGAWLAKGFGIALLSFTVRTLRGLLCLFCRPNKKKPNEARPCK
jgi:hypothetical protein